MLTERSIINFLIWIGGLILGPYLVVSAVAQNYLPLGVVAAIGGLAFIFGFCKDGMCVAPLLGIFIGGRLNFLPLRLAPAEATVLALLLYYLIAYVALQRKKMKTGPMYLYLPILIIGAIVIYHEHSSGLRSIGGGREGARSALFMIIACGAYFCGISVNGPSPTFLTRVPLFCVIAATLTALPYTLSTYVPQTAPLLWMFTDNINAGAYVSDVTGSDAIVRNTGLAGVGSILVIYLISFYPVTTWWRPNRWWIIAVVAICTVLVVMGGFRSSLVTFSMAAFVGAWCYCSWRALVLLPPIIVVALFLVAAQDSHVVHLPEAAQRSLSFLPGDWDPEVIDSTLSSNDFRNRIKNIYLKEDVRKSPLLGNGFSYDELEFDKMNEMARTQDTEDGYYSAKAFMTGKMFHVGWISLYDGVGLIGGATFVFLGVSLIWASGRAIFVRGADRESPLFPVKVWIFCNVLPSLVAYFTVFGDVKITFPAFCYYAIFWVQLSRLERFGYNPNAPLRDLPLEHLRDETPVAV